MPVCSKSGVEWEAKKPEDAAAAFEEEAVVRTHGVAKPPDCNARYSAMTAALWAEVQPLPDFFPESDVSPEAPVL